MAEKDTLFAHLAFKFTGNHELLATEGLAFILQRSEAARSALHSLIARFVPELPPDLRYVSELRGDDGERPDVVGLDPDTTPRVIIEGKFWAGLTDNQPLTYLSRLPEGRPGALAFVVPAARLEVLWPEVTTRMLEGGIDLSDERRELTSRVARLASRPHYALMITWPGLLGALEMACVEEDRRIGESVRQLAGLCAAQDMEAFLPLRAEEISSAEVARRSMNYVRLVDDIVAHLKSIGCGSADGFRATPTWDGWVRYVRLGGYLAAGIAFDCTRWLNHGISPIWLVLQTESAPAGRKALKSTPLAPPRKVVDVGGRPAVPIVLPTGRDYDRVVEHCAIEIRDLVERLREAWGSGD